MGHFGVTETLVLARHLASPPRLFKLLPPDNLAIAGAIVFIFPNEAGQVAVTLVIACMFALVFEALAPYDSKWDAWISRSGHVIVLLSIFVAFLLEREDSEDASSDNSHDLYGGVLLAINVSMVLVVAVQGVTMACSVTRSAEALPRSVSQAAVGFHVQESLDRGRHDGRGAASPPKRPPRRFGTRGAAIGDNRVNDDDAAAATATATAFENRNRRIRVGIYTTRKRRSLRRAVVDFGGMGMVARTSPRERTARVAPANSDDDWEC